MLRGKYLLPALVLGGLALTQAAHAQGYAVPCEQVLQISNWSSERSERGYYTSRVDLRNISAGPIRVSVTYSGQGAVRYPPITMSVQRFMRYELARTTVARMPDDLKSSTTMTCIGGVPDQFRE